MNTIEQNNIKNLEVLKDCNAFLSGHFLLSSGKHSNAYVQCARLLMHPKKAELVIETIIDQLKDKKIDAVVGPAMGGVIVSYEIARQLDVPAMFTERENNEMALRRGFEVKKGDKILITEDVVTTGKSSLETINLLEGMGAEIVGIASIVDRTADVELDYDIISAIKLDIQVFDNDKCELCDKGIELVKPGSRKVFK